MQTKHTDKLQILHCSLFVCLLFLGVQYCTLVFIRNQRWLVDLANWRHATSEETRFTLSPSKSNQYVAIYKISKWKKINSTKIIAKHWISFCLFIVQFGLLRCASNFVVIERDKRAYLQAHRITAPIIRSYRHCSSKYFAITVTVKPNHFDGNFFVYGSAYHLQKSRFRFSHT